MGTQQSAKTELFAQWLSGNLVMADQGLSTGRRVFVHSGTGSNAGGFGASPDKPVATLDYAIGLCTANKGDKIYLIPGHAETFTATNGFDADVAGIEIIGLGWGAARPTFTFNHANAQVNIGAASVRIRNMSGIVRQMRAQLGGVDYEIVDIVPDPKRAYLTLICEVCQ